VSVVPSHPARTQSPYVVGVVRVPSRAKQHDFTVGYINKRYLLLDGVTLVHHVRRPAIDIFAQAQSSRRCITSEATFKSRNMYRLEGLPTKLHAP